MVTYIDWTSIDDHKDDGHQYVNYCFEQITDAPVVGEFGRGDGKGAKSHTVCIPEPRVRSMEWR